MQTLFHIALLRDWAAAREAGAYRVSTRNRTLEQQGYIHLSFAGQVQSVANAAYVDAGDALVLLTIDPAKLAAEVVVEPGEGTREAFPHLYGELPLAAVRRVTPYAPAADGRFGPPPLDNRTMPASVVIPQLIYDDVAEAVAWLCDAFGFVERWRAGDHRAQLEVPGGGCVVVTEPRTSHALHGQWSIMVRVHDVDAHYEHARAFGATIVAPPKDFPYGERQYQAADLGGHHWDFSQSIADVAPEEWGGTSGPALHPIG
ncbi:MAG TPA: DUF952 domain-containing protein [Solirubrobacteraceae bacterium]|nr:DUF952 domain-containing protein [Solirubrobacteraceae bacterium]